MCGAGAGMERASCGTVSLDGAMICVPSGDAPNTETCRFHDGSDGAAFGSATALRESREITLGGENGYALVGFDGVVGMVGTLVWDLVAEGGVLITGPGGESST